MQHRWGRPPGGRDPRRRVQCLQHRVHRPQRQDVLPANNLTGQALGGKPLAPGVYCFNTSAALTSGIVTLAGPSSGRGYSRWGPASKPAPPRWSWRAADRPVTYWVVSTAATIGTGSKFQGNILAGSAVNFSGTGSTLVGRALAKAAVTLTGSHLRLPSNWNASTCRQTP